MQDVLSCLQDRGLIEALTSEEISQRLHSPLKVYLGFDPTADSLHLGHLVGIVLLRWFQRYGHTPVVILGGATGSIGDPSGKSIERPLLDKKTLEENVLRIKGHFTSILDCACQEAPLFLNNQEWFSAYSFTDFLRDVGKHFRVNVMLHKESVQARLSSQEGISFTEFSYQLLQAYDFYYLYEHHGVEMQLGGSDQWGNITAGIELIRRKLGKSAFGITFPLLTRSDGKKFGKTEGGAVWLAQDRLSPYHFYQYLLSTPDDDVIKLMRMLTFMDLEEIAEYALQMTSTSYIPNTAQKRLAEEVTRLVHGEEGTQSALRATEVAAPGSATRLDAAWLERAAADMPHLTYARSEVIGQKLTDLLFSTELCPSKGEATRLIKNGGIYLNNTSVQDPQLLLTQAHLIEQKYLLLGLGKKKKLLVQVE